MQKILIVNPPSFAVKPINEVEYVYMAPYVLASYLKRRGIDVQIFDFVEGRPSTNGHDNSRIEGVLRCGNFNSELISKHVYYIGKKERFYTDFLRAYKPTEVWISNLFTYNWQGPRLVAQLTREFNPLINIKFGGAYATLCPDHAREHIDCDEIIESKPQDPIKFENIHIGFYKYIPQTFPILTSIGCPFKCAWCAVPRLEGTEMIQKDPLAVVDDIEEKYYYGVKRFRFIDSNILHNYERHLKIILTEVLKRKIKVSFCSYGGVNPLLVTPDKLELMAEARFQDVQLPLESCNDETLKQNNRPVTTNAWVKAVRQFKRIKGFSISTYILCGIPGQTIRDIYNSINFALEHGVDPVPLFFTPIPATIYEDNTRKLEEYHPNLFPYASNNMKVKDLEQLLVTYYKRGDYAPDYIQGERYLSSPAISERTDI